MSAKSIKVKAERKVKKPEKPYEGFPLFPHATRRWAKKIRGKFHYFGKWEEPEKALERFNREWPFLSQGRTPPPVDTRDGCTIRTLCNSFLTNKLNKVKSGELSPRTFEDYYRTSELIISHLGKDRRVDDLRPDDFAQLRRSMAAQWGPVKLRNEITRTRMVLKFAFDERLIKHPIHYGQSFAPPSNKTLRKARNQAGPLMFEASELRRILDAANPVIKAMTLLGINCGFGNTDVSLLPKSAVDFDKRWIDFPRPKTEIHRRIPLWSETVDALNDAIAIRPEPRDKTDANLCFLTARGTPCVRIIPHKSNDNRYTRRDLVSVWFGKLLKKLDINGRKGLGFYTLRHVFETIGGESRDQVAVDAIMGHVDPSMGGLYRERISDERLTGVTNLVHTWLFNREKSDEA